MATEEQKNKLTELMLASQAVLNQQVEIMLSITPELHETDPEQVGIRLDQAAALNPVFEAARKELDDYRNSIKADAEE